MSDSIHDDRELRELSSEQKDLWEALDGLPRREADSGFRRRVMHAVHEAHDKQQSRWSWVNFLQPQARTAFGMAAACLIGLLIGRELEGADDKKVDDRVAELESRMNVMGRELLINRLDAASPSDRLAAVLAAAEYAGEDSMISEALLTRAINDPVSSVRAAAVTSLGQGVNQREVADELLGLLQQYDSPTVQLAIIDALLRYGDPELVQSLKDRARQQELHPALSDYVSESTARTSI
ncbi:MAG: HEAT repeat domain-containing protein [Pseudomonadota bacterium]